MNSQRPPRKERTTIAFENLRISGPFSLSEDGELQVEGLLEGDITCHALIVPPGGTVKGRVRADWVVIQGNFCGSIETSVLTASQDAVVIGGVITIYEKILMEPGCLFHGEIVRPGQDEATPDRGFARTAAGETAARLAARTKASWSFKEGNTALVEAIAKGDLEIADRLLTAGADPDAAAPGGMTALTLAVQNVRVEIASGLLIAGADPNLATAEGETPLLLATQRGSASLAEALLAGGADPNLVRSDGSTPLIEAARLGRTEIVRALLYAGADLEQCNAEGEMPMLLAQQRGYQETLDLLRQAAVGGLPPLETAAPEPEAAPETEAAAETEPEPEATPEQGPETMQDTTAEAWAAEAQVPAAPPETVEAQDVPVEAEAAAPDAQAAPETPASDSWAEVEAAAPVDLPPPAPQPTAAAPAELALTPPPSDRGRREAAESILADLAPAPEPQPASEPEPPTEPEPAAGPELTLEPGTPSEAETLPGPEPQAVDTQAAQEELEAAEEPPQAEESDIARAEPFLAQAAAGAAVAELDSAAPESAAMAEGPQEPFLRMPQIPDAPVAPAQTAPEPGLPEPGPPDPGPPEPKLPEPGPPEPVQPAILGPAEIESLSEEVIGLLSPFTLEEARAPLGAAAGDKGAWHLTPRDEGITACATRPKAENGGQILLLKHGQAEGAVPGEIEIRQLAPGEAPALEDLQPEGEILLSLQQPDTALVYWPIHFRRIVLHGGRQAGDYVCDIDGNWSKTATRPAVEA